MSSNKPEPEVPHDLQLKTRCNSRFQYAYPDNSIILHVDKTIPVEEAVKVMDIASRNKLKMVLATKPN